MIAIVILNWNGAKMLQKYLPSVLKYSQDNAEVWVADNASTDNSLKVLKDEFPEVHTIVLDRNYGFAEGYNKADAAISLPAQGTLTTEIYETSGTRYYDKDGNLVSEEVTGGSKKENLEANYASILDPAAVEVVNNKGTELPSTGGIGTTIFYIVGAILVTLQSFIVRVNILNK